MPGLLHGMLEQISPISLLQQESWMQSRPMLPPWWHSCKWRLLTSNSSAPVKSVHATVAALCCFLRDCCVCITEAMQCWFMYCLLSVLIHMSCGGHMQQTACGLLVGLLAAQNIEWSAHSYIKDNTSTLTFAVGSVFVPVCE